MMTHERVVSCGGESWEKLMGVWEESREYFGKDL